MQAPDAQLPVYRLGDPRLPARFWAKVTEDASGCWLWTAGVNTDGYGCLGWKGRTAARAHRVAYEELVGPIPAGLELDHLCRVLRCVRPEHLEPVTHAVNVLRGESPIAHQARQTVCAKGHPLSGENLVRWAPARRCQACYLVRRRAYYARRAEHFAAAARDRRAMLKARTEEADDG